ncbi:MAG: penicillin-binding protein 2 [Thiothrix sp.]|nr:MAG: penicillin-binding protein 2 [Thiothrix sp.]
MTAQSVDLPTYPGRRLVVLFLFLVGMSLLAVRAIELQVFQHDFLQKKGSAHQTRVVNIPAHRGKILDRHGEPLAISTPVDSVWVNPREIELTPKTVSLLSQLLGMKQEEIRRRVESRADKGFVYLKRQVPPSLAKQVKALKLAGVRVDREYRRYYPMGEVFGHLLGFTNVDDQGQEGLELAYDDWLTGVSGSKRVIREGRGRVIGDVELIQSARPGQDLQLSIDGRIQYLAYRELKSAVKAHKAESGSVVVIDPQTGEVLAMANQPSFNPNNRSQFRSELYRNRALKDVFEPGSTAKPFTIAAALESGEFMPTSLVDTSPGFYQVSGFPIKDRKNFGKIDLAAIISRSSNVGASKVALQLAPEQLWDVFQKFGFGQPTGTGFPGEVGGVLRDYSQWYPLDRATLAFGYGFSVTALQLAQAYSVIASDGEYRPLSLLTSAQTAEATPVISPQTSLEVRQMMRQVVQPQGTGHRAAVEGYDVAGKTGTVRKAVGGGYAEDRYVAVFAGMIPVDAPRLVAVVVIHEPKAGKFYGGDVAAPIFSRIMAGALRQLNVAPKVGFDTPKGAVGQKGSEV